MKIATDILLNDLRRVQAEEGGCSYGLYRLAGHHSAETILKRFGTWNAVLQTAGIPLSKIGRKRKQSTAFGRRVALTNQRQGQWVLRGQTSAGRGAPRTLKG